MSYKKDFHEEDWSLKSKRKPMEGNAPIFKIDLGTVTSFAFQGSEYFKQRE